MAEKHVSTLVITPSGGQESGSSSVQTTTAGSFSSQSTKSSSSSHTSSTTGTSTSTKTVSSSTTVKKTSSSTVKKMSMTSSSVTSSSSSNIAIKSSGDSFMDRFASDFGVDINREMERLKLTMDETVKKARQEMFSLTKLDRIEGGKDLVKLDNTSVMNFVDKAHDDRLKFNFDVDEFESESISVKSVGNQIEVHGVKKSKKGDDETNEEFSRTYEMPTQDAIDSGSVTTSFYKDGILTVELPFDAKALAAK